MAEKRQNSLEDASLLYLSPENEEETEYTEYVVTNDD
jgi:hypothetical protein